MCEIFCLHCLTACIWEAYFCVISDFRCQVNENCFLLGYCTVSNSNALPTFRETIGPVFKGLDLDPGKMVLISCPKTSLRNDPEERSSLA